MYSQGPIRAFRQYLHPAIAGMIRTFDIYVLYSAKENERKVALAVKDIFGNKTLDFFGVV